MNIIYYYGLAWLITSAGFWLFKRFDAGFKGCKSDKEKAKVFTLDVIGVLSWIAGIACYVYC